MSRNALNLMHATFNKHHKVSRYHSHKLHYHLIWQKTLRIMVIKCPPNYNPRRDINSNAIPLPKNNPNTNANPKVTNSWFVRLSGTLS